MMLIDDEILQCAERLIQSCESCTPDDVEVPFDWLLDRITSNDPAVTQYKLARPAQCPRCGGDVREKTFVVLKGWDDLDVSRSVRI